MFAVSRMYWPVLRSASTNGPEPTAPTSFLNDFTCEELTFDQMCSGRIEIDSRVMIGLGTLVFMITVVASGAVTLVMLAT